MNEKQKVIFKVLLITAVPVILSYLAKSNNCLDYFQEKEIIGANVNLPFWKDILLIIGTVFSVIFLSVKLAYFEIEQKVIVNQRRSLIKYNKEIFINALAVKMLISNTNINIRIFVPKKGIIFIGKKFLQKITGHWIKFEKQFIIKNIDGLSDIGLTSNLCYEVYPNPQGLVGYCYTARTIIYDENLKKTNTDYNVTEYQMHKTCDIEFCLCSPVFNEKGDVISIISFDSAQKINISKSSKNVWIDMITNYCQFLNDYLPDLFK